MKKDTYFLAYRDRLQLLIKEKFCLQFSDLNLDTDKVKEFYTDGWPIENVINYYKDKFNLETTDSWTENKAKKLMAKFS